MPRKVFVAGEILTAAAVNENLMDQAVMSFANSAARGSAIPSPVEGMVAYLNDADVVTVYDGSAWKNPLATTGGILQVVQTVKTDTFSTNSASYVDVTGLSVSITPKFTSSKILVLASVVFANSTSGQGVHLQLVRDSTAIYIGDSAGSRVRSSFSGRFTPSAQENDAYTGAPMFLDSPNTTSAVTYKIQGRRGNGGDLVVNRFGGDSDDASRGRTASSITVIEVAG